MTRSKISVVLPEALKGGGGADLSYRHPDKSNSSKNYDTEQQEEIRQDVSRSAVIAAFLEEPTPRRTTLYNSNSSINNNNRRKGVVLLSGKAGQAGTAAAEPNIFAGETQTATNVRHGDSRTRGGGRSRGEDCADEVRTETLRRRRQGSSGMSRLEEKKEEEKGEVGVARDVEGLLADLRAREGEAVSRIEGLRLEVRFCDLFTLSFS